MAREVLDIRLQLEIELLRILARQVPATFAVSIVNALIVYFVLSDVVSRQFLWPWLSATIAFNGLRLIMVIVFWRMPEDYVYGVWKVLYLVLVYATGACWGLLAVLPVFFEVGWVQGFIVFVIAGMSAGSILSLYVMLAAAIPYFLVILGPMIFMLARAGEPHFVAMALLTSLFLVLLVRTAYAFNAVARKTVRLELENEQLFHFLLDARETHDQTLQGFHAKSDKTWSI